MSNTMVMLAVSTGVVVIAVAAAVVLVVLFVTLSMRGDKGGLHSGAARLGVT